MLKAWAAYKVERSLAILAEGAHTDLEQAFAV